MAAKVALKPVGQALTLVSRGNYVLMMMKKGTSHGFCLFDSEADQQ